GVIITGGAARRNDLAAWRKPLLSRACCSAAIGPIRPTGTRFVLHGRNTFVIGKRGCGGMAADAHGSPRKIFFLQGIGASRNRLPIPNSCLESKLPCQAKMQRPLG